MGVVFRGIELVYSEETPDKGIERVLKSRLPFDPDAEASCILCARPMEPPQYPADELVYVEGPDGQDAPCGWYCNDCTGVAELLFN